MRSRGCSYVGQATGPLNSHPSSRPLSTWRCLVARVQRLHKGPATSLGRQQRCFWVPVSDALICAGFGGPVRSDRSRRPARPVRRAHAARSPGSTGVRLRQPTSQLISQGGVQSAAGLSGGAHSQPSARLSACLLNPCLRYRSSSSINRPVLGILEESSALDAAASGAMVAWTMAFAAGCVCAASLCR